MEAKFNFRTKSFIIFMLLSIVLLLLKSQFVFSSNYLPISMRLFYLLMIIIYPISLIFLFLNKNWSKITSWILVLIPSLTWLFNPLRTPTNPDYFIGSIPSLIVSLSYADWTTAILQIVSSITALIIIIISITNLLKYENKKFDLTIGILLGFFSVTSGLYFFGPGIITSLILGSSIYSATWRTLIILSLVYIISLIIWNKFNKE